MAYQQNTDQSGLVDKLVGVRRVAKTVKGGRRMAFSALIVIGDEGGRVGFGKGKAREVPDAMRKATDVAKRAMMRVPMRHGRTLHHEVEGRFGSARVILKPAVPGTGIIAGGPMRAVFEAMGMKDVVAKSLGSNNPFNMIQATFDAFRQLETPRGIAAKRGIKTSDLDLYRQDSAKAEAMAEAAPVKPKKAKAEDEKKAAPKKGAKSAAKPKAKAKKDDKPAVVAETKAQSMKKAADNKAAPKKEKAPETEATPAAEEKKDA